MIPIKPKDVTWTDEQWEAIYEDNKNIIVSAGAGSGKTAVLTERVIRKLMDGVHVNELLILTFTKAAAGEMSDRIRKKIKKIDSLKAELNLLNSAYITTFDSFALSVVKKYHYLINVSRDIGIIDASVISIKKKEIMDDLFLELYDSKDKDFLDMIRSFCVKDDNDIRDYILNISDKLDLKSDKSEYLNNYLSTYFDADKINKDINSYFELIKNKIDLIKDIVLEISYIDNELAVRCNEALDCLYGAGNYNEIVERLNIVLPRAKKDTSDEAKELKSSITAVIKEIKSLVIYKDEDEIKESITLTYNTVKVIVSIILEFSKRVSDYKKSIDTYEFNDIAIMAINVLKKNKDVRDELFNSFNEIMIDEYQDTNDLQEEFISMISNHNVYMVGDIKQSIYRFRNANPYIFKNKYDDYSVSDYDKKIDLNKNFRSRGEVLDNINIIFNLVMDDIIGGADYLKSHQMIFGNKSYLKEKVEHSNDMEIYTYNYDKSIGYSREEIEAFIIVRDIIDKYNNGIKVFDKDSGKLRNITYSDFSIIMDRASNFDLYKKVFSYFGIPITILKDEKMNDSTLIMVIRNLISLIIKIADKEFDVEFKYLFVSISRSFLYNLDDNKIMDYFINNSFKKSDLYKKCLSLSSSINYMSTSNLIDSVIDVFDIYNKLITIGDVYNNMVMLDKLLDICSNLEKLGYDIRMFNEYLDELMNGNYNMEYKVNDNGSDSVKIMTIHKSKGLEFPICYFSGLYKAFNISDLKEKFIYDSKFGIIVPYIKDGLGNTIYKELLRDKYLQEEISEKIRLFYVALTRAREKMILIKPNNEKATMEGNSTVLSNSIKKNYRKLSDIVDSIYFRVKNNEKIINIDDLGLSKKYNMVKSDNYESMIDVKDGIIEVNEIDSNKDIIGNEHFSKSSNKLISSREYKNMNFGTKIHEIMEFVDLKSPDYSLIDEDYVDVIKRFLSDDLVRDIGSAVIYKEYEFIYDMDNTKYHGIIDLMLEYDNHIDIIDYKLKNLDDDAYDTQLRGYRDYVSGKSDKKINLYLYSLLENNVRKVI